MSATTTVRFQAAIVALAPVVLLVGFVYHRYIPVVPRDTAVLAAAVAADTTRWALAHLAVGMGSGLLILAFLAIRSYLREAGEDRWSVLALPCIVIGSTLFTLLPGIEFAPLAAAKTGGDIQAAQMALLPWFVPMLVTGGVTFLLGALGFAIGLVRSGVLSPRLTRLVIGALVVLAVARMVPVGLVQFYVQGVAGIVALWPLAYAIWQHPQVHQAGSSRPVPAT